MVEKKGVVALGHKDTRRVIVPSRENWIGVRDILVAALCACDEGLQGGQCER